MGGKVEEKEYSQKEYLDFQTKLYQELGVLKQLIKRESFDTDPLMMGAELEMYLVDNEGYVSPNNQQLLDEIDDDQFQPELNRYNLELNLSPVSIKGRPFTKLKNEIRQKVDKLQQLASQYETRIVPVGILPTLNESFFSSDYITDCPRYHMLSRQLLNLKGDKFEVDIDGDEPVRFCCDDVTVEGANTSFQVHLMVGKNNFANIYNAAQLTLSIVTALSANSPILLGNRVWDETRIALFKQSIDIRCDDKIEYREPARVTYGHGWVRKDAWQLFAESVSLYPVLFPQVSEEDPLKIFNQGKNPQLSELSLHMGTLWPWNRAVYGKQGHGHIRMEFRAIPAGPTSLDMCANAAFAIGLAVGLQQNIDDLISVIPFRFAEYNFYRAAKHGVKARILWQHKDEIRLVERNIMDVAKELLPVAHEGLKSLGVDDEERIKFLNIIQKRIDTSITGARWQKETLKYFEQKYEKDQACREMVKLYIDNTESCVPVAEWPRPWV
ncbi:MAG TPA: hypothetical protein ENJ60_03550 [Aeromonadales bacterium]|nr:hypothetical protein [Aeromonadales bacterium]